MDELALELLRRDGLRPDASAIYLISERDAGVLLEDIGPLLSAVEVCYRRLFALTIDPHIRDLLVRRQQQKAPLHGVSRAINTRYQRLMIPRERQYDISVAHKREAALLIVPGDLREIKPHRVEISRAKVASPWFIELLGDVTVFAALVWFLKNLVEQRRLKNEHEHDHALAVRADRRETIRALQELGYNREEIAAVAAFLEQDLGTILGELRRARARLAPGEGVENRRLLPPGEQPR